MDYVVLVCRLWGIEHRRICFDLLPVRNDIAARDWTVNSRLADSWRRAKSLSPFSKSSSPSNPSSDTSPSSENLTTLSPLWYEVRSLTRTAESCSNPSPHPRSKSSRISSSESSTKCAIVVESVRIVGSGGRIRTRCTCVGVSPGPPGVASRGFKATAISLCLSRRVIVEFAIPRLRIY